MALHVQTEVVGAGEAAVAHAASEGAVAGVFAVVAGQLVRSRKFPAATCDRNII